MVRFPARPIFFQRIDDIHCDRIHSSLTAVHCFDNGYVGKQTVAWKEYCLEYWFKKLQESTGRLSGHRDKTEILLKTALNTRQSINQAFAKNINLVQSDWTDLGWKFFVINIMFVKTKQIVWIHHFPRMFSKAVFHGGHLELELCFRNIYHFFKNTLEMSSVWFQYLMYVQT